MVRGHILLALAGILATGAKAFAHSRHERGAVFVSACRAPDKYSSNLKGGLEAAMSSSHPFSDILLKSRGVVRVAASQVALVTDTAICRRAAAAFGTVVNASSPDRQVHAVRAGIRYAVIDPDFEPGFGWRTGVTFDSSFTQVHIKFAY